MTNLLAGLPDLGAWTPDATSLPVFGRAGTRALPDRLLLDRRDDGSPWLGLTLARHDDLTPVDAFLDLGLVLGAGSGPDGTGQQVAWQDGWLVLEVVGVDSARTLQVSPVSPSGSAAFTALLDLDVDTGLVLRAALEQGSPLTVRAVATLAVEGVAARAERAVEVDLGAAAAALRSAGATTRPSRDDVVAAFRVDPGLLGLAADEPADDATVEAVTDRLLARCTALAPQDAVAAVRHGVPDQLAGRAVWDLAEPVRARRHQRVELDPLAAATALLGGAPADRLVRLGTVPRLDGGRHRITVRDTLPRPLTGVDLLSVRIVAAAAPPHRIQASSAQVVVLPGNVLPGNVLPGSAGAGDVAPEGTLRLAVDEPLGYTWQAAVVPAAPAVPRQLLGPVRPATRPGLRLTPADVPLRIATVTASPGLSALGTLVVTTSWTEPDGQPVHRDDLLGGVDGTDGVLHLAIPEGPTAATLQATLRHRELTDLGVALEPREFGPWSADLDDVPTLGSQQLDVELVCGAGELLDPAMVRAVELRPDDPASPTPPGLVVLTAATPRGTWTYVCTDPFRPGVRHRPFGDDSHPWSELPCVAGRLELTPEEVTP